MSNSLSESAQQAEELSHSHIIKNTFIQVVKHREPSNRRGSTPAFLRLFLESLPRSKKQSDESTTCLDNDERDVSSSSNWSPLWSPVGSLQSNTRESDLSSSPQWSPVGSLQSNGRDSEPSSSPQWSPVGSLQSDGRSDTSSQQIVRNARQCYKAKAEKLIRRVVKVLGTCDSLAHVEASYDFQGCSINVQIKGDDSMIGEMSSFIKKTLLDVSSESKCIYVMGYCSQKAFLDSPRGFEATLAAMENATKACWHVFKKGFCRHDVNCSKQHPVYKMPLKVFVDAAKPRTPATEVCAPLSDFKLLLAGLVHTLTSSLEQSPHIACVQAREDISTGSWTIQLHPESCASHQQACLLVAQNHLLTLINASQVIQIVEHAGWTFVPKPNGFVALLGEKSQLFTSASRVVPISFVIKAAPIELN